LPTERGIHKSGEGKKGQEYKSEKDGEIDEGHGDEHGWADGFGLDARSNQNRGKS
jgi:hypothetical protein